MAEQPAMQEEPFASESSQRALAYVERIKSLEGIPGAERIEMATVRGWRVVVKKGEYKPGDTVVFCEIDSILPKWDYFKEDKLDRVGFRIKTFEMRKQLSQGYCVPLRAFSCHPRSAEFDVDITSEPPKIVWKDGVTPPIILQVGTDLTEFIGVKKWEQPMKVTDCDASGFIPFPEELFPKSDQVRIQNTPDLVEAYANVEFEVTEKVDGASITLYKHAGTLGITTRNNRVAAGIQDKGAAVTAIRKTGIVDALLASSDVDSVAIQGELLGPGIQGNLYKLKENEWRIYDVYLIAEKRFATPRERLGMLQKLGLNIANVHVPIVNEAGRLLPTSVEIVKSADGKSILNKTVDREGLVFKSRDLVDGAIVHFKAVSNSYLLKHLWQS